MLSNLLKVTSQVSYVSNSTLTIKAELLIIGIEPLFKPIILTGDTWLSYNCLSHEKIKSVGKYID